MRRFRNLGLSAALEAEEVVAQQEAEAVEDTVGDNAESLETELLEGTEVVEDNEVLAGQIDEAAEVAESLDEYEEAMESIIAQGGLDRNGARLLNMGLESLQARVGVVLEKQAMPSLESFGGSGSRIEASKYALEGIKETAKKVWDAIIAGINKAIQAIKNIWKYLTDGNVRLKSRAEKVLKAVDSGKAKSLTGKKVIENGSIARRIANIGNVNFITSVKNFEANVSEVAKSTLPSFIESMDKINSYIIIAAKDPELEEIQFDPEDFKKYFAKSANLPAAGNFKMTVDNFPTEKGSAGIQQIGHMTVSFGDTVEKVSNDNINVLTMAEIKTCAEAIIEVCSSIEKLRGLEKSFTDAGNKTLVAAKTFAAERDLAASESGEKMQWIKRKISAAKIFLTRGFSRTANAPGQCVSRSFGVSKSILDYCEVSLKQYK